MASAVLLLSPVTMTVAIPWPLKRRTASALVSLTVSAIAITPASPPPEATRTTVFPSCSKAPISGIEAVRERDAVVLHERTVSHENLLAQHLRDDPLAARGYQTFLPFQE